MAWGFFTLFLAGSFIVIDIVILYVWISAFLMFSGVIYYMESKDGKYKFKFWIEVNAFNGPRTRSIYIVISGATLSGVLLLIMTPAFFDSNDLRTSQMYFLSMVLVCLLCLPLTYFISRFRVKTDEGKKTKHFRGQVKDAEKGLVSSLRSLGVPFQKIDKGQKWTLKMPRFEIEEYGITIWVYRLGIRNVVVTIQSSNPVAASKIGEIERGIDSVLGVSI